MSSSINCSPMYLGIMVLIFSIGVFFHYASDMQKHVHLKLNPNHLIKDGLMAKSRNMNYFGELLIYFSFVLMSKHWIPILVLIAFVVIIWVPNIMRKEKSLSRYPEYQDYKNKSKLLIPFVW